MKKAIFGMAAIALLFTASCKKSDDSGPADYWTVGGTTYASDGGGVINGPTLLATSGDINSISSITIMFNGSSVPTTNGTYRVVASNPGANQIAFTTSINNVSSTYSSTGSGAVDAAVTVSGGKVTINMPNAWAIKTGSTDSVQVSAAFTAD